MAGNLMFVSCSKEENQSPLNQSSAEPKSVPFFEVAKGDSISKDIYREKPVLKYGGDVTVLFSTKTNLKAEGGAFIYDIRTTYSISSVPGGYQVFSIDLNEGAGRKFTYLTFTRTTNS